MEFCIRFQQCPDVKKMLIMVLLPGSFRHLSKERAGADFPHLHRTHPFDITADLPFSHGHRYTGARVGQGDEDVRPGVYPDTPVFFPGQDDISVVLRTLQSVKNLPDDPPGNREPLFEIRSFELLFLFFFRSIQERVKSCIIHPDVGQERDYVIFLQVHRNLFK